jgi:hypothetical protein
MAETEHEQTALEHLQVDQHETLKRLVRVEAALTRIEGAMLKYEPLAAAALRLQDTARMRLLGKGGGRRARNGERAESTG